MIKFIDIFSSQDLAFKYPEFVNKEIGTIKKMIGFGFFVE